MRRVAASPESSVRRAGVGLLACLPVAAGGALLPLRSAGEAAGAGRGGPARATRAGRLRARVNRDGVRLVLTASPRLAAPREPVRFRLHGVVEHASGALVRSLAFGDGTRTPSVMVPQFCLGLGGRAQSGTWTFTHAYRRRGSYRATASVGSNCGGGHASVSVVVRVR